MSPRLRKPYKRSLDITHTAVGDTVFFFAVLLLLLLFLVLSILGAECKQPQLSLQTRILMKRCVLRGDLNPLLSQPDSSVEESRSLETEEKPARSRSDTNLRLKERWVTQHPAATSYTSFTYLNGLFLPIFCHQAQFPLWLSAYFKAAISLSVMVSFACITIFVRVFVTSTLLPARRTLVFL